MKATSFALLVFLSLIACKRAPKEDTPEVKAAQAKEVARCKDVLKRLAALGEKVKGPAPTEMRQNVLEVSRGTPNFDALLADELAAPNEFPKVPITKQSFAECAKHIEANTVSMTDCITKYVVVLKPRKHTTAEVSGSSYTPGEIDADAYVFDMSNGELIGGGRVHGTTPDTFSTKSSNAEHELAVKLGESTFDSIARELNVTKK